MYVGSVQLLKQKNMVEGMEVDESITPSQQCMLYIEAKQHHTLFLRSTSESVQEIGELMVSDIWGPTRVQPIHRTPITFCLQMQNPADCKFTSQKINPRCHKNSNITRV